MVRIRELVPQDYDALIELWRSAELSYRPRGRDARERVIREMHGGGSVFLAAEEDGRIIGAVLGTHDGRKGWINRLAVVPMHRRRGVGRALVEAVEKRLRALGIQIVTCLIEDWNTKSMVFFDRLGYVRHPDIVYFSKRRSPET